MKRLLYLPIVFLFCISITSFAQNPERINYTNEDGIASAVIPDFQVNENAGPNGAQQRFPSISADSSGNFIMTWVDGRNGDWYNCDIYAQRYSSDGTALGTNFKVNDDQGIIDHYWSLPSISADDVGNFVITWSDERNEAHGYKFNPDKRGWRFLKSFLINYRRIK